MTEAQGVELLTRVDQLLAIVELAAWSVAIATGFVIGAVAHRFARGR